MSEQNRRSSSCSSPSSPSSWSSFSSFGSSPWTTTSPTSPSSPSLSPLHSNRVPYALITSATSPTKETVRGCPKQVVFDSMVCDTPRPAQTSTITSSNTDNSIIPEQCVQLHDTPELRLKTMATRQRKQRYHPTFHPLLNHLLTPLYPLISVTTSLPHPSFPNTLLAYHLLTNEQLDDLARYYHQVSPPLRETGMYPIVIKAWIGRDDGMNGYGGGGGGEASQKVQGGGEVDLKTKRRRFGRFIGLGGCESPTLTTHPTTNPTCRTKHPTTGTGAGTRDAEDMDVDAGMDMESGSGSVTEMMERMEREWNQALMSSHQHGNVDSDTLLRWKAGGM